LGVPAGPAHEARCPAVGKRLPSAPVSATMTSAVRGPIPGMLAIRSRKPRNGLITTSIRVVISAIAAVCWSIRSRCTRAKNAFPRRPVPNSARLGPGRCAQYPDDLAEQAGFNVCSLSRFTVGPKSVQRLLKGCRMCADISCQRAGPLWWRGAQAVQTRRPTFEPVGPTAPPSCRSRPSQGEP
jgi:hypothetical protein